MNAFYNRANAWFERAPLFFNAYKYWVLLVFVLLTVVSAYGLVTKFSMDKSMEAWFNEGDRTLEQLNAFREQFGSDDGLYLVYKPADGDVFSEKSLTLLAKLHQEIDDARFEIDAKTNQPVSKLSRIERITSLYNAPLQVVENDTLRAQKLLQDLPYSTQAQRDQLRTLASKQTHWVRAFFSPDFSFGGIRIKTDFGAVVKTKKNEATVTQNDSNLLQADDLLSDEFASSDESFTDSTDKEAESNTSKTGKVEFEDMEMEDYLSFMAALNAITEKPQYQHFTFHHSGTAAMFEFSMEIMQQASMLLLIMVAIMIGLLWFFFRSLSAVLWPLLVVIASAVWTLGGLSWMGVVLSEMANLTFMLVLAVGIADCVHVLSAYSSQRNKGLSHEEALTHAYSKTGLPILLTSLTTMIGMLSLTVSDIPQITTFGISSAVGVMMAFMLTLFVLPSMLKIWGPGSKKAKKQENNTDKPSTKPSKIHQALERLPLWVARFRYGILAGFSVLFVGLIVGTTQVKIDTNIVELTKKGSPMREATEIIDKHMMGAQNMELMVDFKQPDALKDARVLQALDKFEKHIKEKYPQRVIKSFSIAQHVKDTHQILNEDNPEYFHIPDNSALTAQLLYLFDNANPEDRQNLVSDDYSITHVSLMLKNAGSHEYTQFFNDIQDEFAQTLEPLKQSYPELEVASTGALTLMINMVDRISHAQVKSFALVMVIISLILSLSLMSISAGFLSMLPNLLPAVFVSGFMGLLNIPLDTDTLIIAPIIIGIAVDDTIHFMAYYRQSYWRTGDIMTSLIDTTTHVGRAVLFTSLILALGFSVLSFSDYLGMAKTGFGSLAILLALLCDLLLLPALILIFKPSFGRPKQALSSSIKTQE